MEKTGSKPIKRKTSLIDKSVEDLVLLAKEGNGLAFTALWDRHIEQLKIFLKAGMKIHNEMDIDDICSRSFEKAFRQIRTYDPVISKFSTWLTIIAKNTALDLKAQEERYHPKEQTVYIDGNDNRASVIDYIQDQVPSPIEALIRNENEEENEANINKLPSLYREAARKRLIDGMQYKEIAEALNLNENTVKTRISRAKVLLNEFHKDNEK
jgi:RNA polymerase sigma-70 factor (ECF subfamily)